MTTHTIIRSRGAIALGAIFAVGTVAVLFADVRSVADMSIDHLMSLLVLIGTIAAGHSFWGEARAARLFTATGLAILAAGGTAYLVTASASRNAEALLAKAGAQAQAQAERSRTEDMLAQAREDWRKANATAAKACSSGRAQACKDTSRLRDATWSHVLLIEAEMRNMPALAENAGLHHAARVLASVSSATEATVYDKLVLWVPVVKSLFLELATVVFVSIGLGHRRRQPLPHTWAEAPVATVARPLPVQPWSRSAAEADLVTLIAIKGQVPSQDELAARWLVHKGTVSKWLKGWEGDGLVTRAQIGRRKATTTA